METTKFMTDTQGLVFVADKGNWLYFVYIDEDSDKPAYGVKKFHKYSFTEIDSLWGIEENSPFTALRCYEIHEDNNALYELNQK